MATVGLTRGRRDRYARGIDPPPLSARAALAGLPDDVALLVRKASVPAHVRALFSRLPRRLSLVATVPPAPGDLPLAARQLLKLAAADDRGFAVSIGVGPEILIRLGGGASWATLGPAQLRADLEVIARGVLLQLFSAGDLVGVGEEFARAAARLEALHTMTGRMLSATALEPALHVMLSGITSGHALGMNRAALFVRDEAPGGYRGSQAIGPDDAAEAHRIWEAIEVEEKTIEQMLSDYDPPAEAAGFPRRVRATRLVAAGGDEIAAAEAAAGPVVFSRERPANAALAGLGVAGDYLVCAIRPQGQLLGLIVCDNVFSRAPIPADHVAAIGAFVAQAGLVWHNLSLLHRVEELVRTDALTGVLSRRELESRLASERLRAERSGRPLAVLALDVDRFKQINDIQGHAAGDEALRALGAALRASVRAGDHVGRTGGDEFLVVLPAATAADAAAIAIRMGNTAAQAGVSISVGGAAWPDDAPSPADLLSLADARLYEAKRAGRGQARVAGRLLGPFG
jgi:diguanylate cyclase (GGDEF)-like protein